jgi:hypothetical protein
VVGRVCERVEVEPQWRVSDASRENTGRREYRCSGRIDAAEAQHAAAVSRMVAVLLRGRFALERAAIRAADAIDRVQGREHDQYRRCQESSHELIIVCFRVGARTASAPSSDRRPCARRFEISGTTSERLRLRGVDFTRHAFRFHRDFPYDSGVRQGPTRVHRGTPESPY